MNVIIDPTDNMGYPITSEIGRNILKNYLTNYKNGGSDHYIKNISPVLVFCGEGPEGSVVCSSKDPFGKKSSITSPIPSHLRGAPYRRPRIVPGPPSGKPPVGTPKGPLHKFQQALEDVPKKSDKGGWKNFFGNIYNR